MAALVLTSALLDATCQWALLQAPAEEIPDLSGAATKNIVTTRSGEPLLSMRQAINGTRVGT